MFIRTYVLQLQLYVFILYIYTFHIYYFYETHNHLLECDVTKYNKILSFNYYNIYEKIHKAYSFIENYFYHINHFENILK